MSSDPNKTKWISGDPTPPAATDPVFPARHKLTTKLISGEKTQSDALEVRVTGSDPG